MNMAIGSFLCSCSLLCLSICLSVFPPLSLSRVRMPPLVCLQVLATTVVTKGDIVTAATVDALFALCVVDIERKPTAAAAAAVASGEWQ